MGTAWTQDMQTGEQSELRYSYRFICNESYYGESCSKKCTPRDDRFGHYTCTREGQLSCLPGWKGKYCEERKQQTVPTHLLAGFTSSIVQRDTLVLGIVLSLSVCSVCLKFFVQPLAKDTQLKETRGFIAALLYLVCCC